jgi:CheY-like chemotaxis protein
MLFVDDHPIYGDGLQRALTDALPELRIFTAAGVGSALELLAKTRRIDFCLADYRLTDGNGLTLLEEVHRRYPEIAAISRCAQIAIGLLCADPLVRNSVERDSAGLQHRDGALAILERRDRSRRWRALLDYRLADQDNGILIAERIKQLCGDEVAIFLMTAETDEQILAEANAKNLRVLRKPLKPINLRAALM